VLLRARRAVRRLLGVDGQAALRRRAARALPRRRLLRGLPLRDLDALDARPARLRLRPDLGRPALGARRAPSVSAEEPEHGEHAAVLVRLVDETDLAEDRVHVR